MVSGQVITVVNIVNIGANRVLNKMLVLLVSAQSGESSTSGRYGGSLSVATAAAAVQGHNGIDHVEGEFTLQDLLLNVFWTGYKGIKRELEVFLDTLFFFVLIINIVHSARDCGHTVCSVVERGH